MNRMALLVGGPLAGRKHRARGTRFASYLTDDGDHMPIGTGDRIFTRDPLRKTRSDIRIKSGYRYTFRTGEHVYLHSSLKDVSWGEIAVLHM